MRSAQPVAEEQQPPVESAPASSEPAREHATEAGQSEPAIRRAIDQVTRIIEELKQVLNEMEEVLETVELAERQKIDDEREIESLQRALRQLHRPSSDQARHR